MVQRKQDRTFVFCNVATRCWVNSSQSFEGTIILQNITPREMTPAMVL